MKKISLKNLKEVLSRDDLKMIVGGSSGGSGSGSDPNPKITACKDKSENASCSWVSNGTTYTGKCKTYFGPRSCSDL
ncbi:hypothetical protein ABE426_20455 [Sphingobacterium faecium]|uniref:hypothetical protein n=1 Tax=Sphingobacterium faecium TaxID=34087 RepID=UPI00320BB4EE